MEYLMLLLTQKVVYGIIFLDGLKGFKLGVPPILLRHPTNCQILTHSFNVVKGQTNDIGKTLVELINDIQNYTNEWKEQKKCLIEIQKFLNGEKYSPEGG